MSGAQLTGQQLPAGDLLLTGTPGPLLRFVALWIAELALSAGLDPPVLHCCNAAIEDQALGDAVREGKIRAVVVIDDPLSCLSALVEEGHTPLEAARVLTAAAAPLAAWARWPVVHLGPAMTPLQAADAISDGIGLAAGRLRVAEAVRGDASSLAELAASRLKPRPDMSMRTAELQALARDVVAPVFVAAETGVSGDVTWSRACLFWGDHPNDKLPRIIDLTGPARVIAYGPYLHLPPGDWTVRATLAFSPAAIGAPLAVELHSDGFLGRARFKPAAAGVFAASFPARVWSAHIPNEIRVVIEKGAIDGAIGVDHIRMAPDIR